MANKAPCKRCGHRADYHHQPPPHPCGRGGCECKALDIPLLEKPREIGVAITSDKYTLPLYVAGTRPLICFGCGEAIEPGSMFIKRVYCADSGKGGGTLGFRWEYATAQSKRVAFCPTCCPFTAEGVRS